MLILLDELPPYFQAARAESIGHSDLADVTTRALANLLVAVNSGKLNKVCVVFTDLSDTAYSQGSTALADLKKEVARYHAGIEPVKMNSDELYHILRTRLFEGFPTEADISEIATLWGNRSRCPLLCRLRFCCCLPEKQPVPPRSKTPKSCREDCASYDNHSSQDKPQHR